MRNSTWPSKQNGPVSGDVAMPWVEGKFIAVPGSDKGALLEDLKKALEAKQLATGPQQIVALALDAAVLAEKQSRSPAGGFSNNPPGDWVTHQDLLAEGRKRGRGISEPNPHSWKGRILDQRF